MPFIDEAYIRSFNFNPLGLDLSRLPPGWRLAVAEDFLPLPDGWDPEDGPGMPIRDHRNRITDTACKENYFYALSKVSRCRVFWFVPENKYALFFFEKPVTPPPPLPPSRWPQWDRLCSNATSKPS